MDFLSILPFCLSISAIFVVLHQSLGSFNINVSDTESKDWHFGALLSQLVSANSKSVSKVVGMLQCAKCTAETALHLQETAGATLAAARITSCQKSLKSYQ